MFLNLKKRLAYSGHPTLKDNRWLLRVLLLLLLAMPCLMAFQQKPNKVQEMVNLIKKLYKDETRDYITDGEKIVWIKSYKKWVPDDLLTLKKENPDALLFLKDAYKHRRLDVLQQLLPDYYLDHGGVNAYANDIQRIEMDK